MEFQDIQEIYLPDELWLEIILNIIKSIKNEEREKELMKLVRVNRQFARLSLDSHIMKLIIVKSSNLQSRTLVDVLKKRKIDKGKIVKKLDFQMIDKEN